MNKQNVIGLVLIFFVLLGFSYWQTARMEKQRKAQTEQVVKEAAEQAGAAQEAAENATASIDTAASGSVNAPATPVDDGNPFSAAMQGEEEHHTLKNEVFTLDFNTKGGRIAGITLHDYLTYKKEALTLFDEERTEFYLRFFAMNRSVRTDQCYFEWVAPERDSVGGNDSLVARMRLYPNADTTRYLEWVYTVRGNDYRIGIDLNLVNTQDLIASNTPFVDLIWNTRLEALEKGKRMEETYTTVYYKPVSDKVQNLKKNRDDAETLSTPSRWISFKQQFFSTALIADESFATADLRCYTRRQADPDYLKDCEANIGIPYDGLPRQSVRMELFAGPNKYRILQSYDLDLEKQIFLGDFFLTRWISRWAVIPVFDFLESKGLRYGLIILILTILLKIVIFPFTYKSYVSSAKMRVIQPEVKALDAKYPKQEQAMDKQKAVMSLYKKAGISPMAGCLPMLFQLPIIMAMFRFFPAAIELRQQPFLWVDDLSSYDVLFYLPFRIPAYGSHVSAFALMMAVTNLLYTRITMKMQSSGNTMPGMKFMMYVMPIMFLGLLNSYPVALNYYYTISTLITFLQMFLIRRLIDDDKVRARIQENKKKPVKKSKFQLRLEEMARRQQELARQQRR